MKRPVSAIIENDLNLKSAPIFYGVKSHHYVIIFLKQEKA